MSKNLIARASVTVDATRETVWKALTDPAAIKRYMFGTEVITNWTEGDSIVWKGEWKGKSYEDKGVVVRVEPKEALEYTHFSPLSGLPDEPENYHTVTIQLSGEGGATRIELSQDNNPTEDAKAHSEKNWQTMLGSLKEFLEG